MRVNREADAFATVGSDPLDVLYALGRLALADILASLTRLVFVFHRFLPVATFQRVRSPFR